MALENFRLERAELKDVSQIVALVNSAYRGDSSRKGWTTEADFLDGQRVDSNGIAEIVNAANQVILCLKTEQSADLLACVELKLLDQQAALLGMLSVNPLSQNQGIGAKLMKYAEDFARDHFGAQKITMKVISLRTELIAYYQRKGYQLKKEFEPFPYGDARFGLPKRNDLEFVRMEKSL